MPVTYAKIKEFLVNNGMYAPLSTSFLNLTASRCYKIYNILDSEDKEKFWNILKNDYVDLLAWKEKKPEDYEDAEICEFASSIQLYTYDQYKKRLEKGHSLNLDRLTAAFKNARFKKKLRSFFTKIGFARKNKTDK